MGNTKFKTLTAEQNKGDSLIDVPPALVESLFRVLSKPHVVLIGDNVRPSGGVSKSGHGTGRVSQ